MSSHRSERHPERGLSERTKTATAPSETPDLPAAARRGKHRLVAPSHNVRNRAAVIAVAAGAVAAATQAAGQDTAPAAAGEAEIALAGSSSAITAVPSTGPQVLTIAAPRGVGDVHKLLATGQKFAQERAAEEAAKLRPFFVKFTSGAFTSGFGPRWGTEHLGVDVANAVGTPILAVEDGTVLEAGPASGFGQWVRLLHADGTITVYGHVDTMTVSAGQHVMAGDQIATIGNRGQSTGPHCHFEVWLNGRDKVDPLPWLASRGISLGPERD